MNDDSTSNAQCRNRSIFSSGSLCLGAALQYLSVGYSVIPLCPRDHAGCDRKHIETCDTPGKRPLLPWKEYQSRRPDEQVVKALFKRNSHANVGIVMGPVSGLLGLDIDGKAGIELLTKLSGGHLATTLQFNTPGGGLRLLFNWPEGLDVKIKSFKDDYGKEAIRILSLGSQTVAPPSMHACGKRYAWGIGRDPLNCEAASCPQWLIDLIIELSQAAPVALPAQTQPSREVAPGPINGKGLHLCLPSSPLYRARAYLAKCDPAIEYQGGHNQTFKVAIKMFKLFGLSREDAFGLLWDHYNPRCKPPWSEKELRHKVEDAANQSERR